MPIDDERRQFAAELAPLIGVDAATAELAIQRQYERRPLDKRNLVSTLSSVAHLAAMLRLFPDRERQAWLMSLTQEGQTRRDRVLHGELAAVATELCEHLAGPHEVAWDGNWPSAAPYLRGRLPTTANPGDVVIGGDGGGTRVSILVFADDDGVITGKVVPSTWNDSPLEDVWVETYRRLEGLYPEEVPPLVRRQAEPSSED